MPGVIKNFKLFFIEFFLDLCNDELLNDGEILNELYDNSMMWPVSSVNVIQFYFGHMDPSEFEVISNSFCAFEEKMRQQVIDVQVNVFSQEIIIKLHKDFLQNVMKRPLKCRFSILER